MLVLDNAYWLMVLVDAFSVFFGNLLIELIPVTQLPIRHYLLHYPGLGMLFLPFSPAGVFKFQHRQIPVEIETLDAPQAIFMGIPQRTGFFIIQNKGTVVSPTRRHKSNVASIYLAAVHGR